MIVGWPSWRENGKAYHFGLPDDGVKSSILEGVMRSVGGGATHTMPNWSGEVLLGWEVAACECAGESWEVPVRSVLVIDAKGLCEFSCWGVGRLRLVRS